VNPPGRIAGPAWLLLAAALIVVPLTAVESSTPTDIRLSTRGARADSLAIASRGSSVALAWMAGEENREDLWVSVSHDGGRTASAPARLRASTPTASVGNPSIAVLSGDGASVVAVWAAVAGEGRQELMLARSTDGGRSFQVSPAPRPTGMPTGAGLSSTAIASDGRWHALWLTSRREMYYAQGDDAVATAARRLDGAVSRCGVTALATGPGGAVHAFWYRRFGEGDEEFAHVRSTDAGRTFGSPARVSQERWRFPSCPGKAPSLSVDVNGAVRFAFQAVSPGAEALSSFFMDTSADGRTFRPRTFLGAASGFTELRHPRVALDGGGGLTLTWDGVRNNRRYVMIRHSLGAPGGAGGLDADWLRLAPPIVLDQTGAGTAPVVAPTGQGVLAVWVTGSPLGSAVAARRLSVDELCGFAGQKTSR
jgi:hypothetical protein